MLQSIEFNFKLYSLRSPNSTTNQPLYKCKRIENASLITYTSITFGKRQFRQKTVSEDFDWHAECKGTGYNPNYL